VIRALVIVPTYNEAANIETVCRAVRLVVPGSEVLVVDDGSPDGTADLAEKVGEDIGGIHVLRRTHKQGLGPAYLAGFAWGLERDFEAFVEMDADLSHDPDSLPLLLDGLAAADLVIGSRYVPGGSIPDWSLRRRLLSSFGNRYAAWMLGVPVRDLTSGFRAFRADLLRALPLERISAGGYGFQIEMAYRSARRGAHIAEVPIRFVDRQVGESKMSLHITAEAFGLVTMWGLRRPRRPARPAVGGPALRSIRPGRSRAPDAPARSREPDAPGRSR
jgi:dolichol-phosphate mannosyltransferase